MTDFNDEFQLIYHNNSGINTEVFNFQLTEGNPDVYDVKNNLNSLLSGHITVIYDKPRNVYVYKRTSVITTNRTKLYLLSDDDDLESLPETTKRNQSKRLSSTSATTRASQAMETFDYDPLPPILAMPPAIMESSSSRPTPSVPFDQF